MGMTKKPRENVADKRMALPKKMNEHMDGLIIDVSAAAIKCRKTAVRHA